MTGAEEKALLEFFATVNTVFDGQVFMSENATRTALGRVWRAVKKARAALEAESVTFGAGK